MRGVVICLSVLILGACTAGDENTGQSATGYPEPRFPSYLKKPANLEEAMPYARDAVRLDRRQRHHQQGLSL